jgi:hypothetical protein
VNMSTNTLVYNGFDFVCDHRQVTAGSFRESERQHTGDIALMSIVHGRPYVDEFSA